MSDTATPYHRFLARPKRADLMVETDVLTGAVSAVTPGTMNNRFVRRTMNKVIP